MQKFSPLVTSMRVRIIELFSYENIKIMLEADHSETHSISNKFNSIAFLKIVQQHPFVLFVKNNTLTANTVSNNDLSMYATKINYAINLDLLTFIFKNFSNKELENIFINCILVETNEDFKKIEVLNIACFLEKFLEINKECHINKSGKLNYRKLEHMFFSIFSKNEYKKLMKKPGKYFFQSIFGLNVHRKKGTL
ncbi:MAG: hypothetical protein M0P43_10575 [Arcobacteraceae bacterium]|jgi:hypothetical protein|nr:hypothetical protein [Arcobacteraceae bacterium]